MNLYATAKDYYLNKSLAKKKQRVINQCDL